MKVLQVLGNLSKTSGISSFLMNIYRNVDKAKLQFDFLICPSESGIKSENYVNEINALGGKVYIIPCLYSLKSTHRGIKDAKEFFEKHKNEYDIVHLHTSLLAPFILKYAKNNKIKVRILHSHSSMMSTNILKAMAHRIMVSRGKRYVTDCFSCSTEAGRFLYGKNNLNKVKIIYNAIETEKYKFKPDIRKQYRNKIRCGGKTVIIHVSNFTVIKNHIFLVGVIKKVTAKRDDVLFLFIGDGKTREKFENELKEYKLIGHCCFTGRIFNVSDYLQASDLLILPSLKEGLPVSVIEAQAAGLDCGVSDTITRECNTGNVSFLPLEEDKWVQYICEKTKKDEGVRQKQSDNFQNSVFNVKYEAARIEKIYEALI